MNIDYEGLHEALRASGRPPAAVFYPAESESPFGLRFSEFARRLEKEAGLTVEVREENVPGLFFRPGLTLRARDRENVHYATLPEGPEWLPFQEILLALAGDALPDSPNRLRGLRELTEPASLLVFVAAECPHCPGAAREALALALACPLVSVTVVDAQQFPDLADRFGVKAVPHTVIDEGLSRTGVIKSADLCDAVLSRGQEAYEVERFRSLIESGRFVDAAVQIREGLGAASLLAGWRESTMSTRIGLLLAAEEALEQDPAALDSILDALIAVLGSDDTALRGDTADLLGRIGHPAACRPLQALRSDPNPDVAEIAAEAIDEIESAERSDVGDRQPSPEPPVSEQLP